MEIDVAAKEYLVDIEIRCHFHGTLDGAQVAPRRCPILRSEKASIL